MSPDALHTLLAPFGPLRPQPATDWTGEGPLHPDLARLYAEVGPDDLSIPTVGNPVEVPALAALWDLQAGYRWHGRTGARLGDWPDEWLVIADQGGDPFILDRAAGTVLFALHGGPWAPAPFCADALALAGILGTVGTLHEAAGEDLLDAEFAVRPVWRERLVGALTPLVGAADAAAVARRLEW